MTVDPKFIVSRDGRDFVLYAGLLNQAHEEGLKEITTELIQVPQDSNGFTAIVKAVVTTKRGRFAGIGDAAPNNVTSTVRTALIRMAETRAKARALRDATNIGVTAFEELGEDIPLEAPKRQAPAQPQAEPKDEIIFHDKGAFEQTTSPNGGVAMVTQKQLKVISAALPGKAAQDQRVKHMFGQLKTIEDLTRAEASRLIASLIASLVTESEM